VKVAVTGAGGFVGSALVERLSSLAELSDGSVITEIWAIDTQLPPFSDTRVKPVIGNLMDPAVQAVLVETPVDLFFHLAAIPGGAAAANFDHSWSVNVEAPASLFAKLAQQKQPARVVVSSSIGIFGVPLPPDKVDDDTLPQPTMSYGAQKLIAEILLADYARRGLIDGISIRLPGIVARPRQASGHLSAYLSNIFHALAAHENFVCPVSAKSASWFMSRSRCIDNLLHAACVREQDLTRRSFTLPALHLSMEELVDALDRRFGNGTRDLVSYVPNADLEAQFGAYPPLHTPIADGLGFKHDGDAAHLVRNVLPEGDGQRV